MRPRTHAPQDTERRYHEYRGRCCEEDSAKPMVRLAAVPSGLSSAPSSSKEILEMALYGLVPLSAVRRRRRRACRARAVGPKSSAGSAQ